MTETTFEKELAREKRRQFYLANREQLIARQMIWNAKNKENCRLHQKKRTDRLLKAKRIEKLTAKIETLKTVLIEAETTLQELTK